MTLRVHHLNCGTMCPACQRLVRGSGSWRTPGELVCHCLLIETPRSLVLVDTGLGLHDIAEPQRRLGSFYRTVFKPRLALEETALNQVRGLGYDPRDVRHILVTHLDLDHAGGLRDFPWAAVHLIAPELAQIQHPGLRERLRFRLPQFEHQPRWVVHAEQGETWNGFGSIRPIPELDADVLIVPLIGHTKGHAGVAVRQGSRWLLHCGDAYYHHGQLQTPKESPWLLRLFEAGIQARRSDRLRNLARLRQLAATPSDAVELFCAHDPAELARYTASV